MSEDLKLSNQICFPIYSLAKEVINLYRPILKDLDITYPQYLVLLVLWEEDELNVSDIGKKLNLDSGTLTPLLKRLEQKNIVLRKRKTNDERVVCISLTEDGKSLKSKAECIPSKLKEMTPISEEELYELKRLMDKTITQLKTLKK